MNRAPRRGARSYFGPASGYRTGAGDPDLYKFFCQRYRDLVREGGRLGVVLPRIGVPRQGLDRVS